jgi:hypothetical protein
VCLDISGHHVMKPTVVQSTFVQTRKPRGFFLRLSSDLPHSLSIGRRIPTFQLKVDERGIESCKREGTDSKGIRKIFFWWVGSSVGKNLGEKGESGLDVG